MYLIKIDKKKKGRTFRHFLSLSKVLTEFIEKKNMLEPKIASLKK